MKIDLVGLVKVLRKGRSSDKQWNELMKSIDKLGIRQKLLEELGCNIKVMSETEIKNVLLKK